MEDALAEKADVCAVNKKVNYDQFEQAYDELTRNIDETLAKLTQQEALWQQTLDEIQNEIANKLDKADLRPLKDYVNAKLKQLQDRLRALAALKRDAEAAGTKSRFLRNVNCISCDKDVIMRKELDTSLFPPKPGLPPTKSMAPYLAYELDALRKQQRCMPQGRDLNQFENMMSSPKKPDK
ncbi:glutamine-rich protein 2-like [Agrilus planipennis]|uniref:Glutamine-rich protein 2-like n=1 Tax=Agrilus planipennis TaxID=224129 RepID=A0A7F5RAX2_AGRPL|nr:glutamine-rich protein 2-like [Agrilus planipennis]